MFKTMMTATCLMLLPVGYAAAQDSAGGETEFEITGDAEAGERVFRKCMACHAVGEGAQNKVGPQLNGVVGRDIASVEDFSYSDAMVEAAEEHGQWTPETLEPYLEAPRDYVPGTKMAFAGLRKEEERANVIAYLATFDAGM